MTTMEIAVFAISAAYFVAASAMQLWMRKGRSNPIVASLQEIRRIPADARNRPTIDFAWIDQLEADFVCAGFRRLGDVVEDPTPKGAEGYYRIIVSEDGTTSVSIVHAVLSGWMGFVARLLMGTRQFRVLCATTSLSDGRVISTMSGAVGGFERPPELIVTETREQLEPRVFRYRHDSSVGAAISSARAEPRVLASLEDYLSENARIEKLAREFRARRGGVPSIDTIMRSEPGSTSDIAIATHAFYLSCLDEPEIVARLELEQCPPRFQQER